MTPTPSKAAILEMLDRKIARDLAQAVRDQALAAVLEPYLDRPDSEGRSLTPDSQEAAEAAMVESARVASARATRSQLRKMGMWTQLTDQLRQIGTDQAILDDVEWDLD